jgi:osmotically-inducible protein OsmY
MHLRAFARGAALGAAAAYLFDPDAGNGRRAKLRDQAGALLRRSRERADELSRHATNVVEGKLHELDGTADDERDMDDATIADRIRSEVLGRRELQAGGIVVNVDHGVAQLRGVVDRGFMEDVVARTRAVPGVVDVENLLHLPDEPAPNKKAARSTGGSSASAS